MSATPIPRTLVIILYGDLDISVIDELPANPSPDQKLRGRQELPPARLPFYRKRGKKWAPGIRDLPDGGGERDDRGGECPDYTKILRENLPGIRVEYLHGKMKGKEKNKINSEQFAAGNIQVLVSTTVIEVGVNVPNATVMMIENAERSACTAPPA